MKYKLQLADIHCEACKKISEKKIGSIEGVKDVEVDLETKTAHIESEKTVNQNQIEEVLKDTHYKFVSITEI